MLPPVTFQAWFSTGSDNDLDVRVRHATTQAPVARTLQAANTDGGVVATLSITETRRHGPVVVEWLRRVPGEDGGTVEAVVATQQVELAPPPVEPEAPRKAPAKAPKKKKRKGKR
jgi:hypothetical protein